MKKKRKQRKRPRVKVGRCPFCEANSVPSYKEYKTLSKFMNERARILGGDLTGVCSKHQRLLGNAIKRARHLGLLPFAPATS